jgi:hypothetical protein
LSVARGEATIAASLTQWVMTEPVILRLAAEETLTSLVAE